MDSLTVTPEEAAKALGVGRTTIWELIRQKEIDSLKVKGRRKISVAALHRYIAKLEAEERAA